MLFFSFKLLKFILSNFNLSFFRPSSISYGGVHKSLNDLPKIMLATTNAKSDADGKQQQAGKNNNKISNGDDSHKISPVKLNGVVNSNHNNNVTTSHKPPPMLTPTDSQDPQFTRPPILAQVGPAFGENIEGLRSIDSVSSQDTTIHKDVDNSNNNQSSTLSRGMPEIKVRPEEATEFVRNNTVRRSESSRIKSSNTFPTTTSLSNSSSLDRQHQHQVLLSNSPKIKLSLKYSTRTMMLSVVAHRTRNLQESPHTSLPSPYVKTYLIEMMGISNRRVDQSKRKSKIIRNTVNPVFEEALEYFMPPHEIRSRRIELSVCSDNGVFGRNLVLGRCLLSLARIHTDIFANSSAKERLEGSAETTLTGWHTLSPAGLEYDLDASGNNGLVVRSPSSSSTAPGSTLLSRKTRKMSESRGSLN